MPKPGKIAAGLTAASKNTKAPGVRKVASKGSLSQTVGSLHKLDATLGKFGKKTNAGAAASGAGKPKPTALGANAKFVKKAQKNAAAKK